MNLPQYTAGHALYRTTNIYREYGTIAERVPAAAEDQAPPEVMAASCVVNRYGELCCLQPDGKVICTSPPPSNECRDGFTPCGDGCVDLLITLGHCGSCGNVCDAGSVCWNGNCEGGCPNGYTACDGACCVPGSTCVDGRCECPRSCGNCGHMTGTCMVDGRWDLLYSSCEGSGPCSPKTFGYCGLGTRSCDEECQWGPCDCPAPGILCNGICVDLSSNAKNCGKCGTACSTGESCCGGICTPCPVGAVTCSGTGNCGCETNPYQNIMACGAFPGTCTDVNSDSSHCGSCGNSCMNGFCQNGFCQCRNGESFCPGTGCVDLNSSSANCGSCGNACLPGDPCQGGICNCPPGQMNCNGGCTDTSADANNCGGCGMPCASGTCCINSTCTSVPALSSVTMNPNTCNSSQNTNYWLAATDCENVKDLSVTLLVNGALSTDNGFALQLNAVPPQNGQLINWMQYIFVIDGASISTWVEYWQSDGGGNCMIFSNQYEGFWGLGNCCSSGNCCSFWDFISGNCNETMFTGLPTNTIPGLFQLTITLNTDADSGNVNSANFQVTDNDGNNFASVVNIPANVQVPIQSFQYVAVGQDNCGSATFASTEPAEIVYNVPAGGNQQLCVQGPTILCTGQPNSFGGFTGESSNATYGTINTCCGAQLAQSLMT